MKRLDALGIAAVVLVAVVIVWIAVQMSTWPEWKP